MNNKKFKKIILLIALVSILILSFSTLVLAGNTTVTSGKTKYLNLETSFFGYNWVGLKVINDGTPLSESQFPFTSISLPNSAILETSFPGYNLKGGEYYYGSMLSSSFNLMNVKNVTSNDLEANQLFNVSDFPQFYSTNYDDISDNPKKTFCCNIENVSLGGINHTGFSLVLNNNVKYYVLKYSDGNVTTPLFLSTFENAICYNSTNCVSEFLIPKSPKDYNFYLLGKYESYDYDIWIDGVETSTFSQTALPYNLTVLVKNIYSGLPVPNVPLLVGEDAGQNLFIPYTLSGYVSEAYAVGQTDTNGYETFLVAPTVYPSITNYDIYLAVLRDEFKISKESLNVNSKDALITQKKSFSPSRLLDNAVASVNAMNQINSFLYTWSSQRVEALKFKIDYNVGAGTFTTYDLQNSLITPHSITAKTGAPNVFTITVSNTGAQSPTSFTAKVKESNGYLIMNPYTDNSPLTQTQRTHLQEVNMNQEFIITPTSLGFVSGNISIDIINSLGNVIGTYNVTVDPSLNIVNSGTYYNNDLLKTIVNAMNQVLDSLYKSLN